MSYMTPVAERLAAIEALKPDRPLNVTIIGAGMAGLTAAFELQRLGCSVRVLEATDRAGGRVHTWRPKGESGPYHEYGAMRIWSKLDDRDHDYHDYTHHYIGKMGLAPSLRRFRTAYKNDEAYLYLRGRKFRMKEAGAHIPDLYRLWAGDVAEMRKIDPGVPPKDRPTVDGVLLGQVFGPIAARLAQHEEDRKALLLEGPETELSVKLDRTPFGELLAQYLGGSDARDLAGVATGLDVWWHASAAMLLRELIVGDEGKLMEIGGGTDLLPTKLAESLAADTISYNRAVIGIENRDDTVRLAIQPTQPGDADSFCPLIPDAPVEQVDCDLVLCTVPFPVLRATRLSGVSEAKRAAIRSMSYASSTKVLFYCTERVWERDNIRGGATLSDTILRATYYPSDHVRSDDAAFAAVDAGGGRRETLFWIRRPDGLEDQAAAFVDAGPEEPGVLVASYNWDQDARRMGALSRSERERVCREVLEQIHPGIGPTLESCVSRFWDEHPWARGAFAFARPRELPEHFENGRSPEGRLFFAGEHLSFNQGWIQGAIKSSLIAVEAMLKRWR
ncbi:MAG: flavin monoamine oxidase family protein [Allosphingosinicella sp.]|uniref:flavin monoamine oxidase family protein n=1 Tax=Allosphingosinicella sp. TaxID=2823234 RepID=UPI0039341CB3